MTQDPIQEFSDWIEREINSVYIQIQNLKGSDSSNLEYALERYKINLTTAEYSLSNLQKAQENLRQIEKE